MMAPYLISNISNWGVIPMTTKARRRHDIMKAYHFPVFPPRKWGWPEQNVRQWMVTTPHRCRSLFIYPHLSGDDPAANQIDHPNKFKSPRKWGLPSICSCEMIAKKRGLVKSPSLWWKTHVGLLPFVQQPFCIVVLALRWRDRRSLSSWVFA